MAYYAPFLQPPFSATITTTKNRFHWVWEPWLSDLIIQCVLGRKTYDLVVGIKWTAFVGWEIIHVLPNPKFTSHLSRNPSKVRHVTIALPLASCFIFLQDSNFPKLKSHGLPEVRMIDNSLHHRWLSRCVHRYDTSLQTSWPIREELRIALWSNYKFYPGRSEIQLEQNGPVFNYIGIHN